MAMLLAFVGEIKAQLPAVTLKDMSGKTVNTTELSNDG